MGAHRIHFAAILMTCLLGSFAARADEARSDADDEASRAQKATRATRIGMESRALEVRDLLRRTRKFGSRKQVACVDESLSRADVALRRAREAEASARAAWGKNDRGNARLLTRRVAELAFASRSALDTARSCAPGATKTRRAVREGTDVTLVIDPG